MKTLSFDQMQTISGTGWKNAIDLTCAVWGYGRVFKFITMVTPVTAALGTCMDVGCSLWALGRVAM